MKAIVFVAFAANTAFAEKEKTLGASPEKPPFAKLLQPASLEKVVKKKEAVVNAGWEGEDFVFTDAVFIPARMGFVRKHLLDAPNYRKFSSAIKELKYDSKTNVAEIIGEAGGLRMHSWIKINESYPDEINFEIIKGDLRGLKAKTSIWGDAGEKNDGTLLFARGKLPRSRNSFPTAIRIALGPVSELVIAVATHNFRSYIVEKTQEYGKTAKSSQKGE